MEKTSKYNYLVEKLSARFYCCDNASSNRFHVTVEQNLTIVFNDIPHDQIFSDFSDFMAAVMFNYQEFHDKGIGSWKDLNDVLELLEIKDEQH